MPSPGYTSPKTQKGMEARRRAFNAFWKERVHPKRSGSGRRQRGVFVPKPGSGKRTGRA